VIAAAVREVACGRARGKLSESVPELRRTLGLAPHETPAEIERAMLEDGLAPAEWTALATALQPSKATAATLLRAVATSDEAERLLLFARSSSPRKASAG
jgi:ATP-dependent helicase/nuclease subunit A